MSLNLAAMSNSLSADVQDPRQLAPTPKELRDWIICKVAMAKQGLLSTDLRLEFSMPPNIGTFLIVYQNGDLYVHMNEQLVAFLNNYQLKYTSRIGDGFTANWLAIYEILHARPGLQDPDACYRQLLHQQYSSSTTRLEDMLTRVAELSAIVSERAAAQLQQQEEFWILARTPEGKRRVFEYGAWFAQWIADVPIDDLKPSSDNLQRLQEERRAKLTPINRDAQFSS